MRRTAFGSTGTGLVVVPPYRLAGTAPARLSRLAISLPVPSRRLIVSSAIAIVGLPPDTLDSHEQRRNRFFVVNAADRFAQQGRHAQHRDPRRALLAGDRHRIGDHDLLERRLSDSLHRR